jgi:sec-independent protein translocase protein TatC
MSILEHIAELRDRLVKSVLALVVTTSAAGVWLYHPAMTVVTRSYHDALAQTGRPAMNLAVLDPAGAFMIRLRVSAVIGLILALPVVAYQIWRFVAPGLKPKEKRIAVPFALATTVLFALGIGMAVFTLPRAIAFLMQFGGEELQIFLAADRYLRFVLFMGLAFGVAFEFPLVLVFLSMTGVVSSRALLAAWRPAVAILILAAAVITPSGDPVSLFAMAIPLWVFYFGSIAIARYLIEPARARRRERMLAATQTSGIIAERGDDA